MFSSVFAGNAGVRCCSRSSKSGRDSTWPTTSLTAQMATTPCRGGNGKDTIDGLDGDDVIPVATASIGCSAMAGTTRSIGDNGDDKMTGGDGDDLLDGKNGFDIAYYRGLIEEYTFLASCRLSARHPSGRRRSRRPRPADPGRAAGLRRPRHRHRRRHHNAPVAVDDNASINEDAGTYSSGAASVKDNDFDFDGDPLTVTGGTFIGTYGTLTLNADGTYSYTLFASAQALAQGETASDSFNYTVSDNDGSDTGTLSITHRRRQRRAGRQSRHRLGHREPGRSPIDVLANDTDVDNGAILTVHRRLGARPARAAPRSSATRSSSIRAPTSTISPRRDRDGRGQLHDPGRAWRARPPRPSPSPSPAPTTRRSPIADTATTTENRPSLSTCSPTTPTSTTARC